jgi:hypothetical protein
MYDLNTVKKFQILQQKIGVKSILVYLDTPIKTILQREAKNKLTGDRHQADPVNFQNVVDQLEVPTSKEGFVAFKPEDDIDTYVSYL